jgi:ribosomal-protein-serine acetyltransferase
MLPERIEDDGLVLRRWVVGDAEALHAVIAESASHLRPWVRWVDEEDTSIEGRRVFIAEHQRTWRGGGSVLLGMFVGPRIAGGCSLAVRTGAAGVLEIGYWLHPAFCGHGLATRAARLLTEAALAESDVRAVEIRHDKANTASGAVPRRLGYTLVGEAPNRAPAPADSGTDMVWIYPIAIAPCDGALMSAFVAKGSSDVGAGGPSPYGRVISESEQSGSPLGR